MPSLRPFVLTFAPLMVIAVAATAMLVAGVPNSVVANETSRPVLVGGEADLDACGGAARVKALAKGVTATVHAAPHATAPRRDTLTQGQQVALCMFVEAGARRWHGIVYSKDANVDCGVGTPIAKRQPYAGKCSTGWVEEKHLTDFAG
ncbi:MAG: hypothetical protein AAFR04_07585 [Pseudomonadota bacterium]